MSADDITSGLRQLKMADGGYKLLTTSQGFDWRQ